MTKGRDAQRARLMITELPCFLRSRNDAFLESLGICLQCQTWQVPYLHAHSVHRITMATVSRRSCFFSEFLLGTSLDNYFGIPFHS